LPNRGDGVKSVLVTRPAGADEALSAALREAGFRVHRVPTVATEALAVSPDALEGHDWVVVTSATGVAALPAIPESARWAAVGGATSAALAARGATAAVLPERANGRALADAIPDAQGKRILLARAEIAAADLPDRLRERGAEVVELAVYRTIEGPESSRPALAEALADPKLSAAVFMSGSAVRGYLALGGRTDLPAITIGPRTTSAARAVGLRILGEAEEQSAEAVAAAVATALTREVSRDA
jgi:uroporphyrinogen-III synthase